MPGLPAVSQPCLKAADEEEVALAFRDRPCPPGLADVATVTSSQPPLLSFGWPTYAVSGQPTDASQNEWGLTVEDLLTQLQHNVATAHLQEVRQLLIKIFREILQNPTNMRYRMLRKDDASIAEYIISNPDAVMVMAAVGFEDHGSVFLFPEGKPLDPMKEAVSLLRCIMVTDVQVAHSISSPASPTTGSIMLKSFAGGSSLPLDSGTPKNGSQVSPMSPNKLSNLTVTFENSQRLEGISQNLAFLHTFTRGPPVWQWEHRTGWKDYDRHTSRKIEEAYRRGESKVRLKAGKVGADPMEIFFEDMIQYDPISDHMRNIRRLGDEGLWHKTEQFINGTLRFVETGRWQRETFAEYSCRRAQIRNLGGATSSMTTLRSHNLMSKSQTTGRGSETPAALRGTASASMDVGAPFTRRGFCAKVVRNSCFMNVVMFVIVLNAMWLWVDADLNHALALNFAGTEFIIMENFFCVFFIVELLIRYGAYEKKTAVFQDPYYLFELTLVMFMVGETWILPTYLALASANFDANDISSFSVLRTVRLIQLTRLARLLRAFPEVVMLLKGLSSAMRSVFFTVMLLVVLLFVFGVLFKIQTRDTPALQEEHFSTVLESMLSLLLYGTFLDGATELAAEIKIHSGPVLMLVFLLFIFMTSFALLGVLIGILCEVVQKVSQAEKEEAEVSYLQRNLLGILEVYDKEEDEHLAREQFELFMQNPEVHDVLRKFGTDPEGLLMLMDVLYPENENTRLSFQEFFETTMRLRGGNTASVADLVDLRMYVRKCHDELAQFFSFNMASSDASPVHPVSPPPGIRSGKSSNQISRVNSKEFSCSATLYSHWPNASPEQGISYQLQTVIHQLQSLRDDVDSLRTEVGELRKERQHECKGSS